MSVRIEWAPSTQTDIDHYVVSSGTTPTGSFSFVANVAYVKPGANFDVDKNVFFYVDTNGTSSTYYVLVAIDTGNISSAPSQPFKSNSVTLAITNTIMVNENFSSDNALIYQDGNGAPIAGAIIRVFFKSDYDAGRTTIALATTTTNALGGFTAPIFLTTGFTYALVWSLESKYGPDLEEITV